MKFTKIEQMAHEMLLTEDKVIPWIAASKSSDQKELEIEETKPTFLLSTFKTHMTKVGLVFFIDKTAQGRKLAIEKKYLLFVMVCNLSLLDQLQLPILVISGITFLPILQINNQEFFFKSTTIYSKSSIKLAA